MINWQLHHWLLEDVVSARLHVDVLPIPRLFLGQRPLNEELLLDGSFLLSYDLA